MDLKIKHDKKNQKFYAIIEGKEAWAAYLKENDNILNFNHTFVPPEFRDQGIAGKIVEFGLNYARENNFKIIPSCPYVNYFIKNNKRFQDLLY